MNLAVIPARGGSKRIPRKNIKTFSRTPMIVYAISAAQDSRLFDRIIVSTDDPEVADVAQQAGAEIPFTRPAELSDDLTPTVPVVAHAIRACRELGWTANHTCCIYPCVPLLRAEDLVTARELALTSGADFVYPVTEYAHPVQRAMRRLETGEMQFLNPQHEMTRTQDLENTFHDAGLFYWGKTSSWLAHKKMHSGLGMAIPSWRVVDIDSEDDWARAESIFQYLRGRERK